MIENFNNPVIYPANYGTPGNVALSFLRDAMPTPHRFHSSSQD